MKLGRCIKELERIYGVEHGNNQFNRNPKVSESLNQEQLAETIGISVDTLNNYKKLTEMIPELEDLVETGIVAPTTALAAQMLGRTELPIKENAEHGELQIVLSVHGSRYPYFVRNLFEEKQ